MQIHLDRTAVLAPSRRLISDLPDGGVVALWAGDRMGSAAPTADRNHRDVPGHPGACLPGEGPRSSGGTLAAGGTARLRADGAGRCRDGACAGELAEDGAWVGATNGGRGRG
jgi:hypothetical protein